VICAIEHRQLGSSDISCVSITRRNYCIASAISAITNLLPESAAMSWKACGMLVAERKPSFKRKLCNLVVVIFSDCLDRTK
jgi:hypothetical protein